MATYKVRRSNVLMYVDESNMFESARWHSAKIVRQYRGNVPDNNLHIDIEGMINKALGERNLLICRVYTSDESLKGLVIGQNIKIKHCKRYGDAKLEKEVDTGLTASAVEDILSHKKTAGVDRTLILFSGDQDLYPIVKIAMKHGYKVEHWAFGICRSRKFVIKQRKYPSNIELFLMDDIFESITSNRYNCSRIDIPETGLVASVRFKCKFSKWNMIQEEFLEKLVEHSRNALELPMVGRPLRLSRNWKHFLLIPTTHPTFNKCKQCQALCENCEKTNDFRDVLREDITLLNEYFQFTFKNVPLAVRIVPINEWDQYNEHLQLEQERQQLSGTPTYSSRNRFDLLSLPSEE